MQIIIILVIYISYHNLSHNILNLFLQNLPGTVSRDFRLCIFQYHSDPHLHSHQN